VGTGTFVLAPNMHHEVVVVVQEVRHGERTQPGEPRSATLVREG
jgi:hypothetical protein